MKRFLLLSLILCLVAGFFYFDLNQYLSLSELKNRLNSWDTVIEDRLWLAASLYFLAYFALASLSLPGAAVLTLAGGALFGLFGGVVLVSFASSMGATAAFLLSRYVFGSTVHKRFAGRLQTINRGMEKDGAFYLFSLRLVPVFPFFVINLLMGLTHIKTWTFYWVSQVGMLLGTIVYVNAGTQLASIQNIGDIASPSLLISFTLLGLMPLIAKKIVNVMQQKKIYKQWKKPNKYDRNLIVLGAGAGGLVSAYIAVAVKAKVTLIEHHKMGGDCLNYGCVPSKALIKSSKLAHLMAHADQYGLQQQQPRFSFRQIMQRIQEVIKQIEPHDSVERYTSLGVEVVEGYARLVDPWTVETKTAEGETTTLTAKNIVLATGAEPIVPPIPGMGDSGYVTSETLWERFLHLDQPPRRLVVLGGGPIGCELAQSFARLGSEVIQVEMDSRLMRREDADVSEFVKQSLHSDGVEVLTNHKALRCERHGEEKILVLQHASREVHVAYDELLCAVGRKPRLQGFGLEALGIVDRMPTNNSVLSTNEFLQTSFPHIYAVGDVVGRFQFTHTAAHQAWYAAVNALFGRFKKFKVDYRVIPWTTFVDPEVARVGLNEQDATEQKIPFEVSRYDLGDLDRAITENAAKGFIKVLTPPGKDKILGVTIVGEHAGELIAEFVLAMKHGLGLNKILGTIHCYPTWNEANKYVAGEWKKAHKPEAILRWLERFHRWNLK
ncbi:Mercuric reductase [Thalassocella blandensis]|nr:Mercuric reductase [Thalassocella blandensis]